MAQAAKEKEKGNAAFKAGDYPTAIGHYSAAIHADRTDATFPLNRAAAYLKLGKNEDAERDCSTVLSLSNGNVKALFRRAQARLAMGKLSEAQSDLREAARLEPSNQSVKQELGKIGEQIQQAAAASAKKAQAVSASVSPAPKRRRIPITIVEPDGRRSTPAAPAASTSTATPKPALKSALKTSTAEAPDLMKPVSSRPLNTSSSSNGPAPVPPPATATTPKPTAQPVPQPSSFKDAKSARDSSKPSRVGGGIFRASGESTIFAPREGRAASTGKQEVPANPEPTAKQTAPAAPPAKPDPKSKPESAAAQVAPPAKQDTPPPPTSSAPVPDRAVEPPTPVLVQKLARPATQTKSPMTLFDFTRAWESTSDPTARFALLSQIPPSALPSLFQTSLEPALFAEVVDTLGAALEADADNADKDTVVAYMCAFPAVPRFGTVVRFLSRPEKARVRAMWGALGVGSGSGVGAEGTEGGGGGLPPQLEEVWGAVYR
ncbi:hypothetical protein C8F04DRAFT_1159197 [Mycena alexandri]|uniref:RNA polymerase II-associated protein 3 n=1 Tax=Mycena alexandri TaxID=1745969 RepID=A0AAD6WLH0_9AGAR|nr:hypothetical protein C8F04DRAFT_1159197 [Mycena alexandri]